MSDSFLVNEDTELVDVQFRKYNLELLSIQFPIREHSCVGLEFWLTQLSWLKGLRHRPLAVTLSVYSAQQLTFYMAKVLHCLINGLLSTKELPTLFQSQYK